MDVSNAIKQQRAGPSVEKSTHQQYHPSENMLFLTQGVERDTYVHARAHYRRTMGNAVDARKLKLHPTHTSERLVSAYALGFVSLKVTCVYLRKEAFMRCLADKSFHELMERTALRTACTRETRWVAAYQQLMRLMISIPISLTGRKTN